MEIILTEAEKTAASWLDWDDATIGKAVRAMAHVAIGEEPNRILQHRAMALLLCNMGRDVDAETTRWTLNDVTYKGEPAGHYRITIERSAQPYPYDPEPSATWDGDKLTEVSFTVEHGRVSVPSLEQPRRPWWRFWERR